MTNYAENLPMVSDRSLAVSGLTNIRDLGGVPTADGRVIRKGAIFRSDNLRGLAGSGFDELLIAANPRTVIDLRTAPEVEKEHYRLDHPDINCINVQMQPQSGLTQEEIDNGLAGNLVDDYLMQLNSNSHCIIDALRTICDPTTHPVVFHCTVGKDRTGIIAAVLLDILGVDREHIIHDYALTAPNMAPLVQRIRESDFFKEIGLAVAPMWLFDADPETMDVFLEIVDDAFGGLCQWALANGLPQASIDALRDALLPPAP